MNRTAPSAVRRAEVEVGLFLAACLDYQKLLISLPAIDPIAGRIEHIYTKYKIEVPKRSLYGERP